MGHGYIHTAKNELVREPSLSCPNFKTLLSCLIFKMGHQFQNVYVLMSQQQYVTTVCSVIARHTVYQFLPPSPWKICVITRQCIIMLKEARALLWHVLQYKIHLLLLYVFNINYSSLDNVFEVKEVRSYIINYSFVIADISVNQVITCLQEQKNNNMTSSMQAKLCCNWSNLPIDKPLILCGV